MYIFTFNYAIAAPLYTSSSSEKCDEDGVALRLLLVRPCRWETVRLVTGLHLLRAPLHTNIVRDYPTVSSLKLFIFVRCAFSARWPACYSMCCSEARHKGRKFEP